MNVLNKYNNPLKILAGPALGALCYSLILRQTGDEKMAKTSFVVALMGSWWIMETFSIYFTALIPLSLFPILGIMDMKEIAPAYANDIIFLFTGGFLIAFAIEKWNLHRRIAIRIMLAIGSTPEKILLGLMLSSFILSMWISNVATTMMLLPAAISIVKQFECDDKKSYNKLSTALLLGIAYASSIGGTATLVGTAPNMIFMGFYNENFPDLPPINFAKWLLFGLPIACVFLIIAYFLFKKIFLRNITLPHVSMEYCENEYSKLGKMSKEEITVSIVFFLTILLWLFRENIAVGAFEIKGWSNLFSQSKYITDSTVAMLMASVLFLIPSKKNQNILTWEEGRKIPMGILFLFGGGFALAKGISASGLSDWLADNLKSLDGLHPVFMVIILCSFMTFFTEISSNTAATYLILPILLALAKTTDIHPLIIMVPVVFSASYAFMLPVATPPNTIVFGTELINSKDMIKTGVWLNITGIILMTIAIFTIGKILI
jgi:solute carrier family 13 (sodium-dependent dicarboxylate transporter), member 2/3/5